MDEPSIWCTLYPDPDDSREIASIFLTAARIDCDDVRHARENNLDRESIIQLAHRIKGAAAMVGLFELSEEAATLQQMAQQDGPVAAQMYCLERLLGRLITETAQWLA